MNIQKDDIIINLDNVSSIMFENKGFKEVKVIFNFNYGITLEGSNRIIPDYVYLFYKEDEEDLKNLIESIKLKGFITFENSDNPNRYVNTNNVSFIKFTKKKLKDGLKYRIIFNLNSSVSLSASPSFHTSDAVYYDFFDYEEFQKQKNYLASYLAV